MIEAFITNLGKYVEGQLCGEFLKLPATKKDVQELLKSIGVDGILYEEIFITNYESKIPGLSDCLGEYESIDELNYLATLLENMDESDTEKFTAVLAFGEYTNSVESLINLTQNLDFFEFYPNIEDEEALGYYYLDDLSRVPEHLQSYIDYEAYGRDMNLNENSLFINGGYVVKTYEDFTVHYNGREDLPDDCRIFVFPDMEKMTIKDKLNMYQEMVSESPVIDKIPLKREKLI